MENLIQVHTTKDYSLFTPIKGNRVKNEMHIKRLKKSMQQDYLFTIITVNEKYQIIDGQHRFECIKELNLPLHYVICKGYSLEQVQRLNVNSKNWASDDYMNGYCDMGYEHYIEYRKFKEKYGFSHHITISLLRGYLDKMSKKDFKEGRFNIKDINKAVFLAESVSLFKDIYEGYRRKGFVASIIVLSRNKKFKVAELVRKVKLYPNMLVDCTTTTGYIRLIEDIYNYKRKNKVNLRYS